MGTFGTTFNISLFLSLFYILGNNILIGHIFNISFLEYNNKQLSPNQEKIQILQDHCFRLAKCQGMESSITPLDVGLCQHCKLIVPTSECPNIPLPNNNVKILSSTISSYFIRIDKDNEYDNNNQVKISMYRRHDKSKKVPNSRFGTYKIVAHFDEVKDIDKCTIDINGYYNLMYEIYIFHDPLSFKSSYNYVDTEINISLGNSFKEITEEYINYPMHLNWKIKSDNGKQAFYFIKRYGKKIKKEDILKYETYAFLPIGAMGLSSSLLEITCKPDEMCKDTNSLEPCIRISCLTGPKLPKNNDNIYTNYQKERKKSVYDVIIAVNHLKTLVTSETEYITLIRIFNELLIKSLEEKVNNGIITWGCKIKMTKWLIGMNNILGILPLDINDLKIENKDELTGSKAVKINEYIDIYKDQEKEEMISDYTIIEQNLPR
ncbi:uncharacterized protein CMU_034480 [Cryptosporidium muris RN66]|uniref:Uncharacterized protein n=1 Tax=Cryptosporidium muris (strain RN66) TaxID=441375 RepID=B6AFS1_CRYMR|nr:uncharacterized protein CMU_034480 [Cryptosporidium muris RN66]EEA07062.1 hypothetical protein CMU_034480 [Cryptosporidium muris RN66]|eukprot:XP_002141411.1 hypothetical protein [Cryptosporidium muris RN66]